MKNALIVLAVLVLGGAGVMIGNIPSVQATVCELLNQRDCPNLENPIPILQSAARVQELTFYKENHYDEIEVKADGVTVLLRWVARIEFRLDVRSRPLRFDERQPGILHVIAPPIRFQQPVNVDTATYEALVTDRTVFGVFRDKDRIVRENQSVIREEALALAEERLASPEVRLAVEEELADFVRSLILNLNLPYTDVTIEFVDDTVES